jgi:agmatine deiminase
MRDSGPIVIKTEQREALNFNFNGWAKYKTSTGQTYSCDSGKFLDIPPQVMYKGKAVIVEGGAIDSNGRGTLLTSKECLMHPDIQVHPNLPKQITKLF